jgi:mRNA-degrading endonuclease YafQ of YafQ-DinJ toxin-antitoxin module
MAFLTSIVEIGGFDRFMLMLNDKLKHDPIIDPDNVEESVLVKNAIKQAKKYQEQLKKLSKKEDIEDDELEVVLRIFYNALLLDRDFREYSLKRVHNCCEAQNYWDIFSVLFGIFHLSYQGFYC